MLALCSLESYSSVDIFMDGIEHISVNICNEVVGSV